MDREGPVHRVLLGAGLYTIASGRASPGRATRAISLRPAGSSTVIDGRRAVIDLLYRLAYRGAYKMMRTYWGLIHPTSHGALVALWYQGEILLVQNSYVPYRSLPGGYVQKSETGRDAAVRELREETGVNARPYDLRLALDQWHEWEGKREHIEIFELDLKEPITITVDNREVIEAAFVSPERALSLNLFPPLRQVIKRRMVGQTAEDHGGLGTDG